MWEKALYAVEKAEKALKKPRKDPVRYMIVTDLLNMEYRQLATVKCNKFWELNEVYQPAYC
jgi:hypothetical protein